MGSVVVTRGFCCPEACGVFPDQGSTLSSALASGFLSTAALGKGEEAGVKILKFMRTDQPGWGRGGVRPEDGHLILWLSKPVDRKDNE